MTKPGPLVPNTHRNWRGTELLRVHRERETAKMDHAADRWRGRDVRAGASYVFSTGDGAPITPSTFVLRHFRRFCARAGIPTGRLADGRRCFRFHDLRHSTAPIMAARGERPEVIQRVMRHAKVAFTLDRYVRVFSDDIRAAVQRNDRSVGPDDGSAPKGHAMEQRRSRDGEGDPPAPERSA